MITFAEVPSFIGARVPETVGMAEYDRDNPYMLFAQLRGLAFVWAVQKSEANIAKLMDALEALVTDGDGQVRTLVATGLLETLTSAPVGQTLALVSQMGPETWSLFCAMEVGWSGKMPATRPARSALKRKRR